METRKPTHWRVVHVPTSRESGLSRPSKREENHWTIGRESPADACQDYVAAACLLAARSKFIPEPFQEGSASFRSVLRKRHCLTRVIRFVGVTTKLSPQKLILEVASGIDSQERSVSTDISLETSAASIAAVGS